MPRRNKRKTRKNNRTPNVGPMVNRTYSLINNPVRKAINFQLPIYACRCSDGTRAYSFIGTVSSGSLSRSSDLITAMLGSREYTQMVQDFQFVRVKGVRIRAAAITAGSDSRVLEAPTYFLTPIVGTQSTTTSTAALTDIAMQVMPVNLAKVCERYYRYPSLIIGSNGYVIGGTLAYVQASSVSASANLNLLLGYLSTPELSSDTWVKVSVLDIIFDVEFSAPYTQ